MAINSSFFWDGGTEYGQEELGAVFDAGIRRGIMVQDNGSLCFAVTAGTGSVSVAAGTAYLGGSAWHYTDATTSLTVTAPSNYTRIDRVTVYADYVNKTTGIALKAGTPSSTPTPPTMTWTTSRHEITLAKVRVTTAGAITITDERANTSLCGAIRMRDCSEFDEYLKEIKVTFDDWFAQQQGVGWRAIAIQDSQPSQPTEGTIWHDTTAGSGKYTEKLADANGAFTPCYPQTKAENVIVGTKTLDEIAATKYIGVKMSADIVRQSVVVEVPFAAAQSGFVSSADYASLSGGRLIVAKGGLYQITTICYVSDGANQGNRAWHCSIWVNGVMRSENFCISGVNTLGVSVCSVARLNVGDKVSVFINPEGSGMWRLSAQYTNMQMYPLLLD